MPRAGQIQEAGSVVRKDRKPASMDGAPAIQESSMPGIHEL